VVGVPDITPVDALIDNPAGSEALNDVAVVVGVKLDMAVFWVNVNGEPE
jgi:hypothetical protein